MQDGISASFLFATAQGRITTSISSRGNYQHIKGNVVRLKKTKKKQHKIPPRDADDPVGSLRPTVTLLCSINDLITAVKHTCGNENSLACSDINGRLCALLLT